MIVYRDGKTVQAPSEHMIRHVPASELVASLLETNARGYQDVKVYTLDDDGFMLLLDILEEDYDEFVALGWSLDGGW